MRWLGVVLGFVLLLLGGCGGTASTTTRPTSSSATAPASPASTDLRRDDHQEGAAFTTPSGNISCWLDSGVETPDGTQVLGCSIEAKTWTVPTSTCPGAAYGSAIEVTGGGRPGFFCQTDVSSCFQASISKPNACHGPSGLWWHRSGDPTVAQGSSQAAALPYGASVRIGSMQCTSRSAGVTCADLDTGRGFTMSRERYTLTPS